MIREARDAILNLQLFNNENLSNLDYVYTTPERNNAGKIYFRLHYADTIL